MKRFNVFNVLVLILVLCLSGLSQEQNKTGETVDDLLIKFIEYLDKKEFKVAVEYLQKAVELDPTKLVYIEIIKSIGNGKFAF